MNLDDPNSVAIIGLAGRFPGARDVDQFWSNLKNGIESIRHFSDAELRAAGVDDSLLANKNYVKSAGTLDDIDLFDADFFNVTPRNASLMDPQHRLFMEVLWEALENAGYRADSEIGSVGIFGGVSSNTYFIEKILPNWGLLSLAGVMQLAIGNEKDFLCSKAAHHMNLNGPAVVVQTACSTSLVAVHLACQSILSGECDMAMAGGVSANLTADHGYLYTEGGITSPDGHCRAFDAQAAGTVPGNGVGVVVLKSLNKAVLDRDTILAVIRGSAINNDGSDKSTYTAPSINQQAALIAEAHAVAGIDASQISYIETHGTGTILGDPVEIQALSLAFGQVAARGKCAIGSVKTNIGHLDAAAGVAGLIKTVLALKNKAIPASLHYHSANPFIDFVNSPFHVNTVLKPWLTNRGHRIAGVSSFGIGGTNAHIVVEEAAVMQSPASLRSEHVLCLSAKTAAALEQQTTELRNFLVSNPNTNIADVAYTLQVGRSVFDQRRAINCSSIANAIERLDSGIVESGRTNGNCAPQLIFMFPGQGSQYVGMGKNLYLTENVFRQEVDHCASCLNSLLGFDLRDVLFPATNRAEDAETRLNDTRITQPALFVIEYALAKQYMAWGVMPTAMIGHSIGEYVAACLAGVFSLSDALMLVAERGRLMADLAIGRMLAVHASEEQLRPLLSDAISIAAINAPFACTLSGTETAISAMTALLDQQGIKFQFLKTSHAFHSDMMLPMLSAFAEAVGKVKLHPPQIPYLSNVSGTWITAKEATSAAYWVDQVRVPVRFSDCVAATFNNSSQLYLEVGPGRALSNLVKRQGLSDVMICTVASLVESKEATITGACALLSRLWIYGVPISWASYWGGERRCRVALPTYPFQRNRHWIDIPLPSDVKTTSGLAPSARNEIAKWFYAPGWKSVAQSFPKAPNVNGGKHLHLVFMDKDHLGSNLLRELQSVNANVIQVNPGQYFSKVSGGYTLDTARPDHFKQLVEAVGITDGLPVTITYLCGLSKVGSTAPINQSDCFFGLLYLAQALAESPSVAQVALNVIMNGIYSVSGIEPVLVEKSTVLGACKVIPLEYTNVTCQCIDVVLDSNERVDTNASQLYISDLANPGASGIVAYRGKSRWIQTFEPILSDSVNAKTSLRHNGHYIITGGLGTIGFSFAEFIAAQTKSPRITLIGRSFLPPRDQWELHRHNNGVTAKKILQIESLESQGASVLYLSGDIANETEMLAIADRTNSTFGSPHALFHAAGISGDSIIKDKTEALARQVFAPKILGTLILDKIFESNCLDFFILCSSISAISPVFGQVDHCAANAFLDAFATAKRGQGANVSSINWSGMHEIGTAAKFKRTSRAYEQESAVEGDTISDAQVTDFYSALLSIPLPQIIVSPVDFDHVLKGINSTNRALVDSTLVTIDTASPGSRPDIATKFVAPETEIECGMAQIWQDLFGISSVGVNDNFFDLGGHSLLSSQLVAKLGNVYGVNLPLAAFFAAPTIAAMSAYIEDLIIQEIEQLTDEEVTSFRAL